MFNFVAARHLRTLVKYAHHMLQKSLIYPIKQLEITFTISVTNYRLKKRFLALSS